MENQSLNNNRSRKITIKTPQGEIDIVGDRHQNPGICPYCHKAIPLRAIVFKKEDESGAEVHSGTEMAQKYGVKIGQNTVEFGDTTQNRIGECPYCHKSIPMREITFKNWNEKTE